MKKLIYLFLAIIILSPLTFCESQASLISDRAYRIQQRRENQQNIKQIKELFELHSKLANSHDVEKLSKLYAENYINSDGFNKEAYFKSLKDTWKSCPDVTYKIKITSIDMNNNYANVNVEETATGTISDTIQETEKIAGELHSFAKGIYHLVKINGQWYICSETAISDEASLLYGDARFMNIELEAPNLVASGETYTITLKVDADENTVIVGSIDHDPVTYPTDIPKGELRTINKSQILERLIKANENNLNEYAIASMAISKMQPIGASYRIYMAGLACVMRRVNVVPENKFIKIEDEIWTQQQ